MHLKNKAENLYTKIKKTGCKTIIVSSPLCYDVFKNDYPQWGFKLEPDIEVYHISEYINKLVKNGKIKLDKTDEKVTISDSEYLGIFNNLFEPQRELIKFAAGEDLIEMENSGKNLLATGEAAFIFRCKKFGASEELGKRIQKMAKDAGVDTIVTLSATAKNNIKNSSNLKVMDISEFVSGLI